jgi:tRNA-2-methylthio-N6-dimethylallyladenosine synthase
MKFYVENFGCQMNEHDMAKMESLLLQDGLERSRNIVDADIIIVNTCCVREKAEQKFYSFMGRLRTMKMRKGTLLGVTGCIAQMEKEGLKERLPFIDFSLGPSSIHRIREAVRCSTNGETVLDFSENGCDASLFVRPAYADGKAKAYVTVMKGCNNFCTYCIVPFVRGREVSRESSDVMSEIEGLARSGVKEVTLLGQNVNSYNRGREDLSFPELLGAVNGVRGIERIRFVTSHPKDLSEELIDCFGRLEKLCESIHLPFQAGSDRILERMNRGYTIGQYLHMVSALREKCNDIAITSDCIVGFPGEDEDDFRKTMDLVRTVDFDGLYSFAYSPRKFTAAASLDRMVPREEAMQRLKSLQSLQKAITLARNKGYEGRRVEVLVDGLSRHSGEELAGRTRTNKIVNFRGNKDLLGKIVEVEIVKGYANSLKGDKRMAEGGTGC